MATESLDTTFPHSEVKKLNDEIEEEIPGVRPFDLELESKLCEQYHTFLDAGLGQRGAQTAVIELMDELRPTATMNCETERQLILLRDAGSPVEDCEDFYSEYDEKAERLAQGFVETLTCKHGPPCLDGTSVEGTDDA